MTPPAWPVALLSRIEDASLNASAPPQQRWVDGWLLRLSPGKAQRARSINAVADGHLPLAERLALCHAEFQAAGLPTLVRLTPFSKPAGLDDFLAGLGYTRHDDSLVMACDSLPVTADAFPSDLVLEHTTSEAYAHIMGEFRGSPLSERQAHRQRLENSPVPYQGNILRHASNEVVACAQLTIESGMVGLYDVFTAPAWRGRGLSRKLCGALLNHAQAQGAWLGYLQVDALNAPARAVYLKLGFRNAYGYHYRRHP